jgi:hypothetical protein
LDAIKNTFTSAKLSSVFLMMAVIRGTAIMFLWYVLMLAESSGQSQQPTCVIPPGQFEGMVQQSSQPGPWYGNRCLVAGTTYNQVIVKTCLPRYCCSNICYCGSGNDMTQNQCPGNATQISCYGLTTIINTTVYQCCSGNQEIDNTCIKMINCADGQNGGCSDVCLTNSTSGLSYCGCSGPGRVLSNIYNCTGVSAPVFENKTSPFPWFIIVAAVGGLLLLLLLLLCLLLVLIPCCRRRRKEKEEAVSDRVRDNEEKTIKVVISGQVKVKLDDDDLIAQNKFGDSLAFKVDSNDDQSAGEKKARVENHYVALGDGARDKVKVPGVAAQTRGIVPEQVGLHLPIKPVPPIPIGARDKKRHADVPDTGLNTPPGRLANNAHTETTIRNNASGVISHTYDSPGQTSLSAGSEGNVGEGDSDSTSYERIPGDACFETKNEGKTKDGDEDDYATIS